MLMNPEVPEIRLQISGIFETSFLYINYGKCRLLVFDHPNT